MPYVKSQTCFDIFYFTNSTNVSGGSFITVLNNGPDNSLDSEEIFARHPEMSTAIPKNTLSVHKCTGK